MRCIYPHWQHGRLIEGVAMLYDGYPLEVMEIWAVPVSNLVVMLHLMDQGGVHNDDPLCVPRIWYELTWYDGNTAYYKMAKRWRG
jgi:hypothetical protein